MPFGGRETYDVTIERTKTPDHELIGPTDVITYRVTARNPAEARKAAIKRLGDKYGDNWYVKDQERVK